MLTVHTKALLLSTSTVHGGSYLEYCKEAIQSHFRNCEEVLFVPYARPSGLSHNDYTARAAPVFASMGIRLTGLHTFRDPFQALRQACGIFTGGGNTFVLLKYLRDTGLLEVMRDVVTSGVCAYMGSSAGTNLAGITIANTNDMPIAWPDACDALGLVPFNFNPHYLDPDAGSTHMGETRATRIQEFHTYHSIPVLGLREGSWISVQEGRLYLEGHLTARLFKKGVQPLELNPSDITPIVV